MDITYLIEYVPYVWRRAVVMRFVGSKVPATFVWTYTGSEAFAADAAMPWALRCHVDFWGRSDVEMQDLATWDPRYVPPPDRRIQRSRACFVCGA